MSEVLAGAFEQIAPYLNRLRFQERVNLLAKETVRTQFQAFEQLCREIALTDEEQRQALHLSSAGWDMWRQARDGGQVPASHLALMLLRMGTAAHRLSVFAERRRTN